MQKFKNLYFGIFAVLLALALFVAFFFKSNPVLISATNLQTITQNVLPKVAILKGDYLYFTLEGKEYKVAKSSINLQEFGQKVPLEIKNDFNFVQNLTEIIMILIISLVILFFLQALKKQKILPIQTLENVRILKNMRMSQNLLPMKPLPYTIFNLLLLISLLMMLPGFTKPKAN